MGDSLESLIARTQEQLQPLIAKPKLADKLLAKPPFRFLHDVFTAVTQSTGFAKGLYNDFELASANLKDKPQKTAFLDKMIVCVGQCLGKDVDVRSAKIVAGLEPENTNLLLQGLAQAATDKSLDWVKAVHTALAKVPSFTADGEVAPGAAAAPATDAAPAAATRPSSKDRSGSAEAKEKARRESAPDRKAETKSSAEGAPPAAAASPPRSAESKGEAPAPPPSSKQAAPETSRARKESRSSSKDNNVDEALLQSIAECNGDIERTKTLVEQVIAKPKMSPKLLGKPPFRFLHDVISEVTRVTGFAEGLFAGEELDSAAIKEKGPKLDYLTKIILCVGCQLNVEVEAKPAKIVAGLEPEATCKFLQLLTVACKAGSSKEAVQRVLAGDTAVRSAGERVKKPGSRERTPEAKQPSRSSTPPESKPRAEPQPSSEPKEKPKEAEPGSFSGPMKPLAVKGMAGDADDDNDGGNLRFGAGAAEGKTDDGGDGGARMGTSAPGTSGTSRTSRPTTARRRPPKLKENVTEVGRLMVPDAKAVPVAGIMKDGDNNDTDSEDEAAGDDNASHPHAVPLPGDAGAHGRLVRDILKDQSAEEAARRAKEGEDTAAASNEAETGIRLGRRKKSFKPERMKSSSAAAASSLAEMNALRADIQRLCQAANPVGKSVEFVHEDLDAMAKELEFWRKEYARKRDALAVEQKRTEEALQPLQVQLREVEEQVKEQLHKINTLKVVIAKNEEKTQQLLRMVVSA